jgi:uncharacterized protein (UPF0548 family)
MFLIARPSESVIDSFISRQRAHSFSYREVGSTTQSLPPNYTVDRNQVVLGSGSQTFHAASELLRSWQMFKLGWVDVFPRGAPIKTGETVAVLVRHFGFWSLNACRIVYVVENERSFGFAYGTLPDHAEQGEERFLIDWSAQDDSVRYNILAFSRPKKPAAQVMRPLSRSLQRKFARDSLAAMKRGLRDDV